MPTRMDDDDTRFEMAEKTQFVSSKDFFLHSLFTFVDLDVKSEYLRVVSQPFTNTIMRQS
jgi:hypothetical protein